MAIEVKTLSSKEPNSETSSSTESSRYTTTTGSFAPGPGSLSGRAIMALGKLTIRGIDRVIIHARLKSISSKFPHTDEEAANIKNVDEMYNSILELCRPGMYKEELTAKAMRLLLLQIQNGHTGCLIKAVSRCFSIEVDLLLPEIMRSFGQLGASVNGNIECTNPSIVKKDVLSLLTFLSQVSQISSRTCRLILKSGYLELLLLFREQRGLFRSGDEMYYRPFLSRPQLHTLELRPKILNLVCLEIRSGRIGHIVKVLKHWTLGDLRSLLFELETLSPYCQLLTEPEPSKAGPGYYDQNLRFLSRVSKLNTPSCQAVLDVGYLDILISAQKKKYSLEDVEEVHEVVLELLRQRSFNDKYRQKCIIVLIFPIIQHTTAFICSAINKWSASEIQHFIRHVLEDEMFALTSKENHAWESVERENAASMLSFVCRVGRTNEETCHAVLRAGLLHSLLLVQKQNFSIHSIDEKFNIVLEVLRPGIYRETDRRKALDLLIFQVCRGEAFYMIKVLSRWAKAELTQLLQEIAEQFPPFWNPHALRDIFQQEQEARLSNLYLQRVLLFMANVAQFNIPSAQIVVDTGFLDVLLVLQKENSELEENKLINETVLNIICQPRAFSRGIKQKALVYISQQVRLGDTNILKSVARRSGRDLRRLVTGMLEQYMPSGNLMGKSLLHSVQDLDSLRTCISILSKVAVKNCDAFQVLVSAGILDILLAVQDQEHSIDALEGIYDIVLTAIYVENVKGKALQLISSQVMHGVTHHLLQSLSICSSQELKILVPSILKYLRNSLTTNDAKGSSPLLTDSKSSSLCIIFFAEIARMNGNFYQYILDAGLLDVLLRIDEKRVSSKATDDAYHLLLEFSRPILYPRETRERILDFLVYKFYPDRPVYLIRAMEKMDVLRLKVLVSELLSHLCPSSEPSREESSYMYELSRGETLISTIRIMSTVTRISSSACHAVLDTGLLDILATVPELKDRNCSPPQKACNDGNSNVYAAVNLLLMDIIVYPEHREEVLTHPLYPPFPVQEDAFDGVKLKDGHGSEFPILDPLAKISINNGIQSLRMDMSLTGSWRKGGVILALVILGQFSGLVE